MCWTAERRFDSDTRTPSAARRFISSNLHDVLGPLPANEFIDNIELVVSELVTNSVRAGAGVVHIRLQVHHGALELDVTDDGLGWPTLGQPAEVDSRGRGLVLVDALTDSWRAERIETGGKRVTVTMAVPAKLTRSLSCDRPLAALSERPG